MAFARFVIFLGTVVAAAAIMALFAHVALAFGAGGAAPAGILGWLAALAPGTIATALAAGAMLVVAGGILRRAIAQSLGL